MAVPAFLETIERSGLSTWIRESESAFAYYFVLVIHNIGLALLVGTCGVLGAVLLGFVPELPIAPLRRFFRFIWIGFWLNVVSGVFLLIAYPTKALTNPLFYVKLLLVASGVWTIFCGGPMRGMPGGLQYQAGSTSTCRSS